MARMKQFPQLPQLTPEQFLVSCAKAGLTNKEIAEAFGMTIQQFNDLIHDDEEIKQLLDSAKEEPNRMVEQALYKRALGYEVREVVQENGRPTKVTIKEIAPDPVSCIFWLKNRDPGKWRDVVEMKFSLRDRADRAHDAIGASKKKPLRAGNDE